MLTIEKINKYFTKNDDSLGFVSSADYNFLLCV